MDGEAFAPAACEARRARARELKRAWATHPAVAGLRDRLAALEEATGEALIAAARPLLEDNDWLRAAIAASVVALAEDPWFEPPFRTLDGGRQVGLVLWDDRRLRITAQRVPLERLAAHKARATGRRSIGFTGTLTLTRVVRAGGAVLELWEADAPDAAFTATDASAARPAGRLVLADGALFAIDGRRQAWTVAAQAGDMLLVQATARDDHTPLAIERDAETGAFLSVSTTDGASARMQLIATTLRELGRRDAAPALAEAASEGAFFLRWHLLRELVALDRAAALPSLAQAAADPHRELAEAAETTLRLLAA